ncbi:MAG: hypothetical protein BWY82_02806 [Verrucomicrobia bacterium ADurb.Bin474]|nr:MAG: hypothetical protein BWY82_02806 [Verrucomicrobia bacterium ADurb.Bin474]
MVEILKKLRPDSVPEREKRLGGFHIPHRVENDVFADDTATAVGVDRTAIVECVHAVSEDIALNCLSIRTEDDAGISGITDPIIPNDHTVPVLIGHTDNDAGRMPGSASAQSIAVSDSIEGIMLNYSPGGVFGILNPGNPQIQNILNPVARNVTTRAVPCAKNPLVADVPDITIRHVGQAVHLNTCFHIVLNGNALQCAGIDRNPNRSPHHLNRH